jgi:aspartate/methionine/tyrosine aminotransferase
MGVIWVVHEASKLGFTNGNPMVQPGTGPARGRTDGGAPPRISAVELAPEDHAYGPLGGTLELREAVASHVNRLFRGRKRSQYGPENACIASGGRLSTRAFAALGAVNVGYQVPDYTAYEDMFELHRAPAPRADPRAQEDASSCRPPRIAGGDRREGSLGVRAQQPVQPDGNLLRGRARAVVEVARERGTTLLLDEFYSHFVYTADGRPGAAPSARRRTSRMSSAIR